MKTKWGEIYAYIVLLVTTFGMLWSVSQIVIDVYDMKFKGPYEVMIHELPLIKKQYKNAVKDTQFSWEHKKHKQVKSYALYYEGKRMAIHKSIIMLVVFSLFSGAMAIVLRKLKK